MSIENVLQLLNCKVFMPKMLGEVDSGLQPSRLMSYCLNKRKLDYYITVNRNTVLLSSHRGCSKDKIRPTLVLRPSTKLSLLLFTLLRLSTKLSLLLFRQF